MLPKRSDFRELGDRDPSADEFPEWAPNLSFINLLRYRPCAKFSSQQHEVCPYVTHVYRGREFGARCSSTLNLLSVALAHLSQVKGKPQYGEPICPNHGWGSFEWTIPSAHTTKQSKSKQSRERKEREVTTSGVGGGCKTSYKTCRELQACARARGRGVDRPFPFSRERERGTEIEREIERDRAR